MGLSAVTIRHISLGDAFGACLSDRGILMTFGSGAHGVLGHRSFDDVEHPRIVEALLGYEVRSVVCGASHVLALTTDAEARPAARVVGSSRWQVFSWGCGEHGRLGHGSTALSNVPLPVPGLAVQDRITSLHAGADASAFVAADGTLFVCGANRHGKLGLDSSRSADLLMPTPVRAGPLLGQRIMCVWPLQLPHASLPAATLRLDRRTRYLWPPPASCLHAAPTSPGSSAPMCGRAITRISSLAAARSCLRIRHAAAGGRAVGVQGRRRSGWRAGLAGG